jgi:hypothetical protein
MRKTVLSLVAVASVSIGWGCSGVDTVGASPGSGGQPPGETLDASGPFPTEAGTGTVPPEEDASAPAVGDSGACPFPMADSAAPPYTYDASPPEAEDAVAPPYTYDASPPVMADSAAPPYTYDASFPVMGDSGAPIDVPDADVCPAPPPGQSACWASCCTPAGAVEAFSSASDVATAVTGRWRFCSSIATWHSFGPPDAVGIEFAPGGTLYFLVDGPTGESRGAGFAYEWTYDVDTSDGVYQLDLHPTADSGWSSTIRYSPCPRELEFTSLGFGGPGFLVADD